MQNYGYCAKAVQTSSVGPSFLWRSCTATPLIQLTPEKVQQMSEEQEISLKETFLQATNVVSPLVLEPFQILLPSE